MNLVRDTLIDIRLKMGFESAKAFYRHLSAQRKLEFNYAHYMKIEGAKGLPSPAMISAIGSALKQAEADRLTLAYCATIFPTQQKLFKPRTPGTMAAAPAATEKVSPEATTLAKQQSLTEEQIARLTRTNLHYFVFLTLTLARYPVSEEALSKSLKLGPGALADIVGELIDAKLAVREESGYIRQTSIEMRFPKADTTSMQKLYAQIDQWDQEFDKRMGFESLLQKMMIRRVSARYFGVILGHAGILLDIIRASEELDVEHNDDVLMLNLSLSRGRVPG